MNNTLFSIFRKNLCKNNYGFTIIELLVVLLLVVLTSSMVFYPSIQRTLGRQRVKGAIYTLLMIRDGLRMYNVECKGYPWRETRGSYANSLSQLVNGARETPPWTGGNGSQILPTNRTCSVGLRDVLRKDLTNLEADFNRRFDNSNSPVQSECPLESNVLVPPTGSTQVTLGWNVQVSPNTSFADDPDGVRTVPNVVLCAIASGWGGRNVIIIMDINGNGTLDMANPPGNLAPGCAAGAYCIEKEKDSTTTVDQGCCRALGYRY